MTNSPSLKEALHKLANLAGIEEEIRKIKNSLNDIPINLKEVSEKFKFSSQSLDEKKLQLAKTQEEILQMEKDVAESKELLKARETKLYEIKTTKEYQATQKEIASAKKSNIEKEIKLPEWKQKAETLSNEIATLESDTQALNTRIQEEESRIGSELEALQKQLEEKLKSKDQIFKELEPAIVTKYEKVLQRKQPAMAAVGARVCLECNINIPAQLYSEIQKHTQMINCPSCFRILYIPDA